MDRKKILDKIEKCLRLSKSANEHEAAAALRQAQKMMAQHGLSEADLAGQGYGSATVDTVAPRRRKLPIVLVTLTSLITHAFGVTAVTETHYHTTARKMEPRYRVRYWGPEGRVQLATYAHEVVWRAMNNAYAKALKENPDLALVRNARINFRLAWLNAVRDTVAELGMTSEDVAATAIVKKAHYGKDLSRANVNTSANHSSAAQAAGRAAADGFSLHRPMNGTQQRRLGNS